MYKLTCRIEDCSEEEFFDSTMQILGSDWEEVSAAGINSSKKGGERVYEHKAYCKKHTL